MKILHVSESVRGGCGTYLNEIAPLQIQEFGQENVRVIIPAEHRPQLSEVSDAVVRQFRRPQRVIGIGFLLIRLLRELAAFRPDVVHAHSTFAGVVARLLIAVLMIRRPVVVYCPHGWAFEMEGPVLMRRLVEACERWLSGACDRIIAISQAECEQGTAVGIQRDKLKIIENGIAPASPSPIASHWPAHKRRVLFVGRLDRQKGVDILLEAVAGLGDQISVRIVGEAVASKFDLCADLAHVEWLGWRSHVEVAQEMNACDLLVVASRWEGFGLVAIEAMRAGKPVVATMVGGLTEIVKDGVTGRLVPPEDSVALRTAILAHSDDELRRMGQAGLVVFRRRYTSNRTHRDLRELYETLMRGRAKEVVAVARAQSGLGGGRTGWRRSAPAAMNASGMASQAGSVDGQDGSEAESKKLREAGAGR